LPEPKELSALYSKQLYFRDGSPLIPVRLMEGREVVTVASTGPIRIAIGGATVMGAAGSSWTIRRIASEPAIVRTSVQLAELPFADSAGLAAERELWERRGLKVRTHTIGALYGVRGKVIDNRRRLLLLEPAATASEAEHQQESIFKTHGRETLLFEELEKPAHGTLQLEDGSGHTAAGGPNRLTIESLDESPLKITQVEYGVGYDFHGFEDRSYRGAIDVTVDRRGRLAVVNLLSLEDLLRGLVPAEMFSRAPTEALKAQAITARTEVLAKIGTRHLADPYFLCAEQHCAVYRGISGETPTTNAAVDATRGIAVFSPDGHLVNAVYSAVCGGHTENNEVVWGGLADPSLRGKPDFLSPPAERIGTSDLADFLAASIPAACRLASFVQPDRYRWTRHFSSEEMNRLTQVLGIGPVEAISVSERGVSGRARAVTLSGQRKAKQVRGELEIRKLFGMLNSSMFLVEAERDADGRLKGWIFRGGGWGHGVGMCQMGAIGRAEAGHDYRAILRHYFSGAEPSPLY
jgi:SpoIID/LytB domain protein